MQIAPDGPMMGLMAVRGVVAVFACVLGLSACAVPADRPGPSGQVPTALEAVTTATEGSAAGAPGLEGTGRGRTGPTFPLTLRRTGGIADFHDTVVLTGNGTLSVDTDTIHGRTCQLDKATSNGLLVALSTLRLAGPRPVPTDVPVSSDASSVPITVTVTDVHHRPVQLDDPSLGEIRSRVAALVGDVALSAPARTRCTTPGG